MAQAGVDSIVYRDIEKFYRVLGYYEGQVIKPLEIHEKFIDESLENHLRQADTYIRRLQYNFMMTEVLSDAHVIFKTDKPEVSLVYSLFSEGILALIALRELGALDVREWCSVVRQTLIDFDQGNPKDLASVLWRSPSRNLRTRVYTSLMDLEMSVSDAKSKAARVADALKEEKAQRDDGTAEAPTPSAPIGPEWHERDQEWVLPSGESVEREASASKSVDVKAVKAFKNQMLSGAQLISKLPPELQVETLELARLAEELSSYDANHVEFNLLNWVLGRLKSVSESEKDVRAFATETLDRLTHGIVARFQPSLLLYLLYELKDFTQPSLRGVKAQMEEKITKTLGEPGNERRLISSLKDLERAEVTKKLLPFLQPAQFPTIIDFYVSKDDKDGLVEFLTTILGRNLEHENLFFSWGEDRLCEILPLFRRLEWPKKYEFLKRAIRSPSLKLAKQASYYLINIPLEAEQALQVYRKAPDELREIWLRTFIEHQPKEAWAKFMRLIFSSKSWLQADSGIIRHRLMMGWCEVALKYFKAKGVDLFRSTIQTRRWWLWPEFPAEREAALTALLGARELREDPSVQEIFKSEARVRFQSPELRDRLKGAVK